MRAPGLAAPPAALAAGKPLPAAPRTPEASRKFQAAMLTELMRPLFPHLTPLGALSSASGSLSTEVVGFLFGEAISAKLAERDPFGLGRLVAEAANRRHAQSS
jgi:hypothetical protein